MTYVTVDYRLLQPAGHHRQPRTNASWVHIPGGGSGNQFPGTAGTQTAPAFADTQFVFWSVSDGHAGSTTTNPVVNYTVSGTDMTVTAWYLPLGRGTGGEPGYLIDAFSVAHGDFVDDDFVTVTSDPSLTSQANVAGWVPTSDPQTVEAFTSVAGTGEDFEHWIGASAADRVATFPDGGVGFAIATYKHPEAVVIERPDLSGFALVWLLLLGGVTVDGGGWGIGPGGGGPIGPWGPFLQMANRAVLVGSGGAGFKGKAALEVQLLAAEQIGLALRELQAALKKQQG